MDISINLNINNVTLPLNINKASQVSDVKTVVDNAKQSTTAKPQKEQQELLITMKDSKTNSELTAKYYVDKDTSQYVVQFLDKNKEVIKQIPAEYMIELAKYLDKYKGLFVEEKA